MRHWMSDPQPHLSTPLVLSLEIISVASCLSFPAHRLLVSSVIVKVKVIPYLCLSLLLLLDTFATLFYILFDMRGPELHRWTETMNLCYGKATFAVLSSMSLLIILNAWFIYLTTTEHWTSASQWHSRIPQSALLSMMWITKYHQQVSSPHSLPWLMNIFRLWGLTVLRSWRGTVSEQGDSVPC